MAKSVYFQTERWIDEDEVAHTLVEDRISQIQTAQPIEVVVNDPKTNTAEVQITLKQAQLQPDGTVKHVQIPTIKYAPLLQLGGGGMHITIPVQKGDGGLAVFASRAIDSWWKKGGVQDQIEARMHRVNDAFIIPGFASQPKKLDNVNTTAMQMRTTDGKTNFEFDPTNKGKMTLTSPDNPTTVQGKAFDTKVETSNQKATTSVVFDTPTTNATGNLNVTKKITAGQGLQVAGGATISGGASISGGVSVSGGISSPDGSFPFVPLAGGTMTGLLTINFNTGTPPAWTGGTSPIPELWIVGQNGISPSALIDCFGTTAPWLIFRRANGTAASPTSVVTGDNLGVIAVFGRGTTTYGPASTRIDLKSIQTWTDTAQGTAIAFSTTTINTTTGSTVVWFQTTDPGAQTVYSTFSPKRWRLAQNAGDEINAGCIDYRGFDAAALSILGAGTTGANRLVRIYDNFIVGGTSTLTGAVTCSSTLGVTGAMTVGGVSAPNIQATGASAWLGFHNRSSPGSGDYGWYCSGGTARLYNGADRFTINASGGGYFGANTVIQGTSGSDALIIYRNSATAFMTFKPEVAGNTAAIGYYIPGTGWGTLNFPCPTTFDQTISGHCSADLAISGGGMTGSIVTSGSNGPISQSSVSTGLEVRSLGNTHASYIVFHRPGNYAIAFGLDTDNQLAWGGWSYGAARRLIWDSGNFTPGNYLPLTGGNLSGTLYCMSNLLMANNVYIWFLDTNGSWRYGLILANDNQYYLSDGSLNLIIRAPTTYVNGALRISCNDNTFRVVCPNGQHARLWHEVSGTRVWSNGCINNGDWYLADESVGRVVMTCHTDGNTNFSGAVTAGANMNCWDLHAGGGLYVSGLNGLYNAGGWWYSASPARFNDLQSENNCNVVGHYYCNGLDFYNNGGWWYTPNGVLANGNGLYSYTGCHSDGAGTFNGGVTCSNGRINSQGGDAGFFFSNRAAPGPSYWGWTCSQGLVRLAYDGINERMYFNTNGDIYPYTPSTATCGNYNWWNVISSNFSPPSDPRLKQDIELAPPALDCVRAIPSVTYRWKHGNDIAKRQHGWLSTDVRKVMGDDWAGVLHNPDMGVDCVSLNQLTAVLWRAVQELAAEVETLKAKLH